MVKGTFKQIDLLRKRRDTNFLLDPYFIDNRKYIKKGLLKGLSLILISLILGIPFIFRTKFLDNKKEKIKPYSDEYDLLLINLDKEQKQLKEIAKFNKDLKNSIINISSSSALFQEIALIIPKEIQLLDFISKENSLVLKTKLSNEEYLQTINSFLIMLDNSELIKFEDIDLKEIKVSNDKSKNKSYLVKVETKISNNYSEINDKYLIKLGSYGLFNRLNILKNIDESSD